jgi:hypothetical protein
MEAGAQHFPPVGLSPDIDLCIQDYCTFQLLAKGMSTAVPISLISQENQSFFFA